MASKLGSGERQAHSPVQWAAVLKDLNGEKQGVWLSRPQEGKFSLLLATATLVPCTGVTAQCPETLPLALQT